jgi:excisionase family DNA binding protein
LSCLGCVAEIVKHTVELVVEIVKQTYSVEEAARILGVGRNSAYEAVRAGQIPAIRVSHRILVPRAALERLLEGFAEQREAV